MENLKASQEKLGCPGCYYADERARTKGRPCCTHPRGIGLRADGTCDKRKAQGQ